MKNGYLTRAVGGWFGPDWVAGFTGIRIHVSQAENLPQVGYMVTADKFFVLTYIAIFVTIVGTVIAHQLEDNDNLRSALKVDKWMRYSLPLAYFCAMTAVAFVRE